MDDQTGKQFLEIATNKSTRELYDNDPIGLPDVKDMQVIARIISKYSKNHPGEISTMVQHAQETADMAMNDFNASADPNSSRRHVMTMPVDLYRAIEKVYPLMFVNRDHMRWFMKNYPMFNTYKRY